MKRRRDGDTTWTDGPEPPDSFPEPRRTDHGDEPDTDYEELEQIPWGMLSAELGRGRRITTGGIVLCVLAAVVAAVVGLTVLRRSPEVLSIAESSPIDADISSRDAFPGPGSSPPGAGESAPAAKPPTGAPEERDTGASTASPAPVTPAPALYSEADLMAVMPEHELRLASVTAETFVAGWFTRDGVEAAAGGTDGPSSATGATTWVERVGTVAVAAEGPGAYRATVVVAIITGDPDGMFSRLPLRSVSVPVVVGEDGTAHVADLPTPVPTPISAAVLPDPDDEEPAPEKVMIAARGRVPWEGPVEVTSTHRTADGWRVHLTVDAGVPLVVEIPHP